MKLIALAAALAASGTAIAQEMPQQSTTTTTTTTTASSGTTGAGTVTEDPKGGYMPSGPALSGTPMPGQPVIFVPSPSPSEAYPAPAPLAHYPICKRGQFDNCRQRGG